MLSKPHRLTKKKDFDVVFNDGKSAKKDFLLCKATKNNLTHSRFGFVVSKKISLKAVVRNKVRRRLQNATNALLDQIKKPSDVVLVALPGIETQDVVYTQEVLSVIFKKLNLI